MSRQRIDYPALSSPSIRDISFAAGFYEGEGSLTPNGTVQIVQNDREILDKMQSLFGGKVYGPYKGSSTNEYHVLTITRERALGFLLTIFTMLSKQRRKEIKSLLEGQKINREYKQFNDLDRMIGKQDLDKFFGECFNPVNKGRLV
jgi:hypothetical protein